MPAKNNRTLVIDAAEKSRLRSQLLDIETLRSPDAPSVQDRIVHADLFEAVACLPDQCADLLIIDPPYNLTKRYGDYTFAARHEAEYEAWLRSWMLDVCRKLKPTGSLYLCGDWRCTSSLQRVLSEELTVLNRITWQREKGRGAQGNWKNCMEDIWFAVKDPEHYTFNLEAVKLKRRVKAPYRNEEGEPKDWEETDDGRFRLTCPSNFWDDIVVPFWSMRENTGHPTQKPEKLYAKLILASSNPGDMVLDPFLGSGTSAVVAHKLGRHFCGIELNEEYCLWALKRLEMAHEDNSIQGYRDGCFLERSLGK